MKNIVHIFGASGSGTSTLGKALAEMLGYKWMDTDDYFWEQTDPPYTTKRSVDERLRLMKEDIESSESCVISGSLAGWGDDLIPYFTLVVRLVVQTDVRIERIRKREAQKMGERILPGGDMYEHHLEFIEWAKKYDTGDVNMRSKAKHNAWQNSLPCKTITLDGTASSEENCSIIERCISL